MDAKRRHLLRSIPLLPLGLKACSRFDVFNEVDNAINWEEVKNSFPISSWDKLHLNSGSAGVMPTPVQEYLIDAIRYMNSRAPYEAWSNWQTIKKSNILRLGELIHASSDSIEIVRNTTEALNMLINGLKMKREDEVIISNNAYPFAVNAWENKKIKDGIAINRIQYTLPLSDDEIVRKYTEAITLKTKVIHITHMTHREGHIQPMAEIINLAHKHNIQVVVDGAHCVGQIPLDLIADNVDYYASSLHKWLNAPHGTGLLYVRPQLISTLYNHPSSYLNATDSIHKFEHIGTRAFHQEIGISAALDYHDAIGLNNKLDRLQALKEYCYEQLKGLSKVTWHTNIDRHYSGGVFTLSVQNYSGGQLVKMLDKEYDIHIKSVGSTWGSGIRVSVNVFHDTGDLDKFIAAIQNIAA